MIKSFIYNKIPGGAIGLLLGILFVSLVMTHYLYLNYFISHHQLSALTTGTYKNIFSYSKFSTLLKYATVLMLLEICLIFAVVFYGFLILRFSVTLKSFKQSAEDLGLDINTPIHDNSYYSGGRVVEETKNVLSVMQQRIKNLIETRTTILTAISHDLRTPLTRLQMRLELLEPSERVDSIMNDAVEMEIMISEILSFSQEENQLEEKAHIDLNQLLATLAMEFTEMGHEITFNEADGPVMMHAYSIRLKRAFANILQNAMKYATCASIHLSTTNNNINVVIEDNGPGIPKAYLNNVFKAFNRAGETQKPGIGMGLNIVHNIIEMHCGTINLANKDGGLQVNIQFPHNQNDEIEYNKQQNETERLVQHDKITHNDLI